MHDMSAVFINEYDKVEEPLPDFYVHDVSLPAFIGPFGMFRPGVMYSLCYLDTDEREYIVLRGYNGESQGMGFLPILCALSGRGDLNMPEKFTVEKKAEFVIESFTATNIAELCRRHGISVAQFHR